MWDRRYTPQKNFREFGGFMGSRFVLLALVVILAGCGGVDWFPAIDPNAPASIELTSDKTSPVVGGSAKITATVKKSDGTIVGSGVLVSFSATAGGNVDPSSIATSTDGTASTTLTATGPGPITVTVSTVSVNKTISVTFVGPVTVAASSPNISAVSGGSSNITATVLNTDGTPSKGATVTFTTSAGSFS